VRDTGLGIPPDQQHRLFQSFSQLEASTVRKYGGTGLGLAISKRLVELMEGTIWVESEGLPGQGSTFHFTIQAQAATRVSPVYLSGEQPHLMGKRALIVDGHSTNQKVLAQHMRAWGMQPVMVESGEQALALLRQGEALPFDVAILDAKMQGADIYADGLALALEIRRTPGGSALPLVMLAALGALDATQPVTGLALLPKPIKASQLYNTLVGILVEPPLALAGPEWPEALREPPTAERPPLRILVTEDNLINQKLALSMLAHLGYRADVAANGLEALEALARQPYDVILMDVQMPEMDGLEATRRIRQGWAAEAQPHIIALTANALQSDREDCLVAGMNDYLSKPVPVEALRAALERAGRASVPTHRETGAQRPHGSTPLAPSRPDFYTLPIIDQTVLARFKTDVQLLPLFIEELSQLLVTIRDAVARREATALRQAAHTLKGSSGYLGAERLKALSAELEELGRSGSLESAGALLSRLDQEAARVHQALEAVQGGDIHDHPAG
jgi:CheY-like chemotaxis protein/HPt (histidine-containing phosphotransfer) domain-containing protein